MINPFLNQTDFTNVSPLGGGKYKYIYSESLSIESGICLTGNENTALTIELINVKLEGKLVIGKVKSLTIILRNSEIIGDIYVNDSNYLGGSIDLDEKSKLCGNVNFNEVHFTRFHFINLKVSKSVTFSKGNKAIRKITEITETKEIKDNTENDSTIKIMDIKTIEERKEIKESNGQIKNLNFSGKGRIGKDLVFIGGSLTDINIKGLDIHGDFKIGNSAEIYGSITYSGEVIDEKLKNFIKGNFEIDQSVRFNLRPNNTKSDHDMVSTGLNQIIYPVIQFERVKICGRISINNLTIAAKFRMRLCEIEESQFLINTTFLNLADFYGTTFKKAVNFFKCDFNGVAVFSDVKFDENALFTFSEFKSHLIFRETKFRNNSGLDLATSIITSNVYFQHVKMGFFDISREDISDASRGNGDKGQISAKNRSDTFRILKKYAKDNDDSYEYNHFGYLEARAKTDLLLNDLKGKLGWYEKFNLNQLQKIIQDLTIHLLNFVSNRHRASWLRAIIFICISSTMLFWFTLLAGSTVNYSFQGSWRKVFASSEILLQLIFPFRGIGLYESISNFEINNLVLLLDLLNRILVGYGYYQFVQAFRRFK